MHCISIYLNPWTYLQSYWDSFVDSCKLDFRFFHQNQKVSGIWRNSRREWQWPRQWREWWRRWGQLESTSLWAHSRRRWWSTRLWSQDKSFDRNSVPDKREVLEGLRKNRKLNHMKRSNTMYKNEIWLHLFQCSIKNAYYTIIPLVFRKIFLKFARELRVWTASIRHCPSDSENLPFGNGCVWSPWTVFLIWKYFSLQCRMRIWLGLFTPV